MPNPLQLLKLFIFPTKMSSEESPSEIPTIGLIVCGPCACGKSEVAFALAHHYQVPFVDADTFHSPENIKKMGSGIPLTDDDRFPWLLTVRQQMILQKKATSPSKEAFSQQVGVVAACSALTKKYRNILAGLHIPNQEKERDSSSLPIIFVFLNCSEDVLQKRLNARQGHFMKANMLSSQLATLEVPNEEEVQRGRAIIVNGDVELINVLKEATDKMQAILSSSS